MNSIGVNAAPEFEAPPASLASMNPLRWLTIFGPGAIIASLTIGTGELIFSSRGGALFGYRVLFLFVVISVFKWVLVFSTARHMVLTGVHPLRRWLELPFGPRGWLPAVMFVFAAICIPIWVSFHASILGELFASLTNSRDLLNGATKHLWGAAILICVVKLALAGGYAALEKVQIFVVVVMLIAVSVALILLRPDWLEMLLGIIWPRPLAYPEWLLNDTSPEMRAIAAQPIWVEASLYVGVIGGAGYDYLAYTSFLRDKRWGLAGARTSGAVPTEMAESERRQLKQWIRAPLIDCTVSFIIVILFSAVFVTSGWLVLGPRHEIPAEGSFLDHQKQFLAPSLYPLYVVGTMFAMLGTLYGTLEVAPAVLRESFQLLDKHDRTTDQANRLRRIALLWSAAGAFVVLMVSFAVQCLSGASKPPGLTTLLIPANLFTGVLSCGIICLLNPWMDLALPRQLRPAAIMVGLNVIAGSTFVFVGIKGYWDFGSKELGDFGGSKALGILAGTIAAGFVVARVLRSMIVRDTQTGFHE